MKFAAGHQKPAAFTLCADNFIRERRHLGIGRILRDVDQTLVTARILEAGGNEMMHAEMAHVAERYGLTGRLLGFSPFAGYGCNRTNAPRINSAPPKQIWINFIRIC